MATSKELEAKLAELKAEYAVLSEEETRLEVRLREIRKRQQSLWSSCYSADSGEIKRTEQELKRAKLEEADAIAQKVRVEAWGCVAEYVVSRVTPKRIYLRRPGQEREIQYNRADGTSVRYGDGQILDMAVIEQMARRK